MSGLLRRIKRSPAADAGQPSETGQAAAPEGAGTQAEPALGANPFARPAPEQGANPFADQPTGATAALPATDAPAADTAPVVGLSTPAVDNPTSDAQPVAADPAIPAGLDPTEAVYRPPAGRRGRLRRRLRFLRRARELMLRDLGGLTYEIHRTGGGDMAAHEPIVAAKLGRISAVDAETRALETALGAPRSETTVFQPGIGGTCAVCGELYGSAARFCSECGTPIGAAAPATPTAEPTPAESLGLAPATVFTSGDPLAQRAQPAAVAAPHDADVEPPAEVQPAGAPTAGDEPPAVAAAAEPATDVEPTAEPTAGDEPAAVAAAVEPATGAQSAAVDAAVEPATEAEPAAVEPAAVEPAAVEPAAEAQPEPAPAIDPAAAADHTAANGRRTEDAAPDLSTGDPLSIRERS